VRYANGDETGREFQSPGQGHHDHSQPHQGDEEYQVHQEAPGRQPPEPMLIYPRGQYQSPSVRPAQDQGGLSGGLEAGGYPSTPGKENQKDQADSPKQSRGQVHPGFVELPSA
jgi:hypothetical protein